MSLIVVPYEPVHAMLIPDLLNEPGLRTHPEYRQWAEYRQFDDEAVTTLIEDTQTVAACFGVRRVWEDVGEAWLLLSVEAAHLGKSTATMAKRIVDRWSTSYRRLQATVDADSEVSKRFVEFLGMKAEGRLRKYGPLGRDHIMYARVQ